MTVYNEKEKLLLEFIVSSVQLFTKVINLLEPEYYDEPLDQVVVFIKNYYMKYKNLPKIDTIKAETGIYLESRTMDSDEFDYVLDEVEKHSRNNAMRIAILNSAEIVNDDNDCERYGEIFDSVRNVLMINVDRDIGINQFEDVFIRHRKMQENVDSRSIGWHDVDNIIDNVRRGELVMFAGASGSGKSVCLSNVTHNMAKQKLDVVLITLELREELISKRLDSIITGISSKEVFDKTDEIQKTYSSIDMGNITIKKLPNGSTANDVRSYLLEYTLTYGHTPDVLVVDYLDLMNPINKKDSYVNGIFGKDKAITEELRDVFVEYNVYGFTASQLNRDSIDQVSKSMSHIAGGMSKINTADTVLAISRTEEQIDRGEIELQPMKLRNAEMIIKPIILKWNSKNLQLTEKQTASLGGFVTSAKSPEQEKKSNKERMQEIIRKSKRT